MPYVTSRGCRIYYESHGSGPTLALVHGAGGNHAIWWQQVARLHRTNRVVTIDLRGFGLSETVEGGPDCLDFPHDIHAVLLGAEATDVALLGQSIGAVAALRCGVANPGLVKGVLLANSVGGLDHPDLSSKVKADRSRAEKLTVLDRLLTKRFQKQEAAYTLLFQQIGSFNSATMQSLKNVGAPGPTPEQVRAAGIKVFFIAGEVDSVLSPQTVSLAHELLPDSVLELVTRAPHSMYWETPDVFNSVLERCLDALWGAR